MTAPELYRVAIDCPHCRATNTIATNTLSPDTTIVCSTCHGEIGPWRDLVSGRDDAHDSRKRGSGP